ncbi:hypothetical protein [Cronobacter phage EspYZU13]|uniref:Uncharacterized protein n=1 Tax=Cronobacter phage EspYZU13 TaxID=3003790 RepID=A0AAE9W670_9CAUD|nr:hypothetical protein [Cronobacter phage EspYZU13]
MGELGGGRWVATLSHNYTIFGPQVYTRWPSTGLTHRVNHRVTVMGIYGFTHSSPVLVHLLNVTQELQSVLNQVSILLEQRRLNRVGNLTG